MKCDELKPIELECNMGKDINGVEHREPWKAYDIDEVDAAIAELKRKLHDAEMLADLAEAAETERKIDYDKLNAENRKLKRALWLAREWRAWCEGEFWLAVESDEPGDIYHLKCTNRIHRTPNEWTTYWQKVEQLCKKKAEE